MTGKIKIAPWQKDADAINYLLELRYHKDQVRNVPQFRLSWSTNQTEWRVGRYHLYYMENIFLREEVGKLEVPKYPYLPDCWLLEMFVYAPVEEIPESKNGHYEVIYPFLSSKQEPLEPRFDICEILIYAVRNPQNPRELLNRLAETDEKRFKKDIEYFKDILEDEGRSWLWTDPHAVVTVPKNYERPEKVIIPGTIGISKG